MSRETVIVRRSEVDGARVDVVIALSRPAATIVPRSHADWADPLDVPLPPRPRTDPGAPLPLGLDTDRVLAELGIA